MNMLNCNCKTSFAKPEFLKKAQRANPCLYDIGCYNDNLTLMLAPESDEPNAFKSQRPSILGKPTIFSDSLEKKDCSKSKPQLKSNQIEDRVMLNNSQGKKQEVEEHRRNVKFSKNKTFVTTCNDCLNAKTLNVNFVCVTCGKCVLNENHNKCVLHYINGVNSRTKMPMVVSISIREPKRNVNQSVATPLKRTVASESTNQKPRHTTRKLYEHVTKTCSWWYPKFTPPGYKWKPKSQIGNVNPNVSMPLGNASRTANTLEPMTPRYTQTYFLRSKDETPEVLIDLLRLIQRGLHAQMASDHVSSDPVPKCPMTAFEHDCLSPGPQCQENVPHAAGTVTTSNELDFLFSLMFNELLNGSTQVVFKSSAVTTADAPNKCQHQHTTPLNTQTTPDPTCQDLTQAPTFKSIKNINQVETITENAQVEDDEFINIFCTPVQDQGETLSHHVDSSNMHTFYQQNPSEHRWMKDHPLEQVIRNPSQSVRIRHQLESDGEMCMFALTMSRTEPKNIKEAMADSTWIESMQEELHQFDRLDLTYYGFHFDKIPMYCDSKAAKSISCNPVQHSRTKHIDVRYHFIKEKVEKCIVELFFVGTEYQLADLFTKPLSEDRFKYLVRRLGMRCLTPEELGVLANEYA
uniref:Retrotransposon protein, putative, unclassified n=1 Tax=Tanacetum cinerariifolium TaxID=118510 RepID=A0A6L2J6R4_TANCI|nr:retrotransposon protein, putative, unclassified [Tanacetum cinerariifolium]